MNEVREEVGGGRYAGEGEVGEGHRRYSEQVSKNAGRPCVSLGQPNCLVRVLIIGCWLDVYRRTGMEVLRSRLLPFPSCLAPRGVQIGRKKKVDVR